MNTWLGGDVAAQLPSRAMVGYGLAQRLLEMPSPWPA